MGSFLISAAVVVLGITVVSTAVSNLVLILLFAIPFTIKLNAKSLLKSRKNVASAYGVTALLYSTIFCVTTGIFFVFLRESYFISLLIGYALGALALILTKKAHKINFINFVNYFDKNRDCFSDELTAIYDKDKNKLFAYILKAIENPTVPGTKGTGKPQQ